MQYSRVCLSTKTNVTFVIGNDKMANADLAEIINDKDLQRK